MPLPHKNFLATGYRYRLYNDKQSASHDKRYVTCSMHTTALDPRSPERRATDEICAQPSRKPAFTTPSAAPPPAKSPGPTASCPAPSRSASTAPPPPPPATHSRRRGAATAGRGAAGAAPTEAAGRRGYRRRGVGCGRRCRGAGVQPEARGAERGTTTKWMAGGGGGGGEAGTRRATMTMTRRDLAARAGPAQAVR